jgi:hypothetical protein
MLRRKFQPGDPVVYRKAKHSTCPGPRAESIDPAPRGEDYTYEVDKYWIVVEIREDKKVLLRTRRGKDHLVDANSPSLRRANWWERLLYRNRFPSLSND